MLNFPTRTINLLKRYLLRQQREVEKNIKEVEEDDPAKSPALAETSEPGTDSYIADVHTKIQVLKDQLKKTSNSIKSALSKMRKGTYGKCERCDKQIEIGRLLVIPTAQYCLICSKKTSK